MFVGRFKCMLIVTMLNIVTALVTEAERPAMIAKLHKIKTRMMVFMSRPLRNFSMGFSKALSKNKIIPICNPDIAKI